MFREKDRCISAFVAGGLWGEQCPKGGCLCPPAGRPYRGKPSDMWALGVVLFTMLYGQFPFYDSIPQELFRKIKAAEYTIPE